MSEFTEEIGTTNDDESASQVPTDVTDATEIVESTDQPEGQEEVDVESPKESDGEQNETKDEGTPEATGHLEVKPSDVTEDTTAIEKPSVEGLESEEVENASQEIEEEIEQADEIQEVQAAEAEEKAEAEENAEEQAPTEKEGDEVVQEEATKVEEEELTEGEKMLKEIDTSKAKEEGDTELDYEPHVDADLEAEVSRITLHGEDLPEIRGLAELEYESAEESQKEVTFDNIYLSKRRSVRPSMALKLLQEEEALEKRRLARKEMGRGSKTIQEEEEEPKEVEEKLYTRDELYAEHEKLYSDIVYIRMKNRYLQRKCADFFKKRRMEHALKEEGEISPEALAKYEKKLDRLSGLLEKYQAETQRIRKEMELQQKERDDKYLERDECFLKGVAREREIGIGLISTKTGKEIPDKVVDQLIRRQTTAAKQISDLRLKFINLRDEIAEKTAELKSLDNIGEDLSLMDYEQLKIENRAHSDKLEEKEEELTKLRVKCRNAVQIMAHVREKCAALDADMDVLKEEFEEVHYQFIEIRERLNFYKTERDIIRNKTMKLKAESGLLTKPKLLQDMETSMQEVKLYEETLQKVKNEYNEKTQQIRNLRKNIAYEMVMNKKQPKEKKKKTVAKFFRVRPTLMKPTLPTTFFDRLAANSSTITEMEFNK